MRNPNKPGVRGAPAATEEELHQRVSSLLRPGGHERRARQVTATTAEHEAIGPKVTGVRLGDLRTWCEHHAAERGESLTDVIRRAVQEYRARHEQEGSST